MGARCSLSDCIQIIILNLNKIKNIGGDKILMPTKHWRQQNIGADNINASTKLLVCGPAVYFVLTNGDLQQLE
jgi:hypothetical protein